MNLYHFFFLALFSLLLCNCLFPISFLKDSILLLANCLTIDDQENEVIIISISNNILETQGNRLSSVAGGTVMYLKGSGFASVLTKNVITVGNVPATILRKTEAYLKFVTPALGQEGDYNLSLVVLSRNTKIARCVGVCTIYYRMSFTPEFNIFAPRSASAGESLTLSGYSKTAFASNVKIKLGQFNCDKGEIDDEGENERSLNTGSYYSFECKIPKVLEADYYTATITVTPQGATINHPSFSTIAISNITYDFQCVPLIQKISTKFGSPSGQKIWIYGTGFSEINSHVAVQVGNLPCEIISLSAGIINCQVSNAIKPNTTSFYIKSNGMRRLVYDCSGASIDLLKLGTQSFQNSYWRNNLTNRLLLDSLENDFAHISNDFTNSVEVYTGYFKPPVDGLYSFSMTCDNYCELYLSTVLNSSEVSNLQNLITWKPARDGLPYNYNIHRSSQISLNANSYYLIQGFKSLYTTTGSIKVGVEIPQEQSRLMQSIQYIRISYEPTREKLELKAYNWKSGTFKIVIDGRDPISGDNVYHKETQALDYNITENNLTSILSSQLGWGRASLKKFHLDKAGQIISNNSLLNETAGFFFEINLTLYRDSYQGNLFLPKIIIISSDTTPITSFIQTQVPTPFITGEYTLKFGDTLMEHIQVNQSSLIENLKLIPEYNRYFTCELYGSINEDRTYVIKFTGMKESVPLIEVITSNLQGGNPGTSPQIFASVITESSNTIVYDTIPYDLIYQADSEPQVNVYVNGIASKCQNDNCLYQISNEKTPILRDYNLTSDGLSLLLDNYLDYNITIENVQIHFALTECVINNINLPYLKCSIPLNSDGNLSLSCGTYQPLIHIDNIGFVVYDRSLKDTTINLTIIALNATKGSVMGGQNIAISGFGFPLNGVSSKIGNSSAIVLESSNNQILIQTNPKIDFNRIVVSFNSQTAYNDDFEYSDTITPIINSISLNSSSPVQKAEIKIQGTGFGDSLEKIKVFLDGRDIIYELSAVSIINGEILAILGGGKAGKYKVRVVISDIGSSKGLSEDINTFYYELVILGIRPNRGSVLGGTLLTITGINFSPTLNQNQVFIGDDVNQFCDIVSSNNTEIKCKTRIAPDNYLEINQSLIVTQRVQEESRCGISECSFTYSRDSTPEILLKNDENFMVNKGDLITLNGSKLKLPRDLNLNGFVSFIQEGVVKYKTKTNDLQENNLTFAVPAMVGGLYSILIEIPNKGIVMFSHKIILNNTFIIKDVTLNDGNSMDILGSKGGVILNISGNGFGENDTILIQNTVGNCVKLNIYDPTRIICKTKALPTEGVNYTINLVRNTTTISCEKCTFQVANSSTPLILSHNASKPLNQSNFILNLKGSMLNLSNSPGRIVLSLSEESQLITSHEAQILFVSSSNIIVSFSNVPAGEYLLNGYFKEVGFFNIPTALKIVFINHYQINLNKNIKPFGYFGGANLTFSSSEVLFGSENKENLNVTICGFLCEIIASRGNMLTCKTPIIKTKKTMSYSSKRKNKEALEKFQVSGDSISTLKKVIDGNPSTYYDSGNDFCWIGFDFGIDFHTYIEQIDIFFNNRRILSDFYGLVLQYSLNGINYTDLLTLGPDTIKSGKNKFEISEDIPVIRSIRLQSLVQKHTSRCSLAEVAFYGARLYKNSTDSITSQTCDVKFSSYNYQIQFNQSVQFSEGSTPKISSFIPKIGTTLGGTNLTINGSNFGGDLASIEVEIDGVKCTVSSVNSSAIVCVTGSRSEFVEEHEIKVTVGGNNAVIQENAEFLYVDRWSDPNTWWGESPPRKGDSVYIPPGQTILLDVSTELLNAIIIEGGLIFEDRDITLDANYLVSMGGYIQIGTSESPFLHKAIITMHGSRQDTQLPLYGNKVWALQDTTLEINGEPRNFLRSTLSSTVLKEQNTITVKDKVDWNVGDQIVIASSDYIHSHAEVRYIKSIAGNSIVLNKPLNYQHYSSIDKYGNTDFPMETEVALLTRNIVFQGFIDKDSRRYGAHIYSSNQDSTVKISYCEFKNVGQANILDRYPINIHNIENAADSYLIGNSIHNSYARAINIYNTNNLRVRNNLAYFIFGSAFVLESGLEANNIIDNNLGISIMQSWTLHNIDTTPAVFYISSPKNVIINNSAAGGDWAGFQYDLSDVSSLDPYICPSGAKLLKFSNNIAHSNAKFGLYIYKYIPRNMPCNPSLNLRANDWLLDNPGIKTVFNNFIAFSNRENGVVAEYVGNLVFDNFLIADSVLAGIQISDTKNTYIDGMILSNSVLVGLSLNKINNQENSKNIAGLITPRSDNLLVFNVSFYNFTFAQSMTAITTCSKCNSYKLLITGGKTTKFELLNFINVDRRILWGGYKKEVFLDIDGSLTNLKNSMITSFYPHLDGIAQCNRTDAAILDDSILCNSSVQIRTLIFRNLAGARSFVGLELKVYRIPDLQFNVSGNLTLNSSKFTKDVMKSVWQDTPYSWSLPFVTGHIYNVHWHNGNMDFTKMNLRPSLYWNSQDKSIILKFNCSDYKDDYNVKILQLNGTKNNVSKVQNFNSFSSGDYSFSNISNDFIIGINGNNNGSIDINTIRIAPIINDTQNLNDTQNQNETRNTTTIKPDWDNIRYWSNASLWPNKMVPLDGEDVLIEADWVMYLDVDTANLGTLIIDGFMSCKSTSKLQLRAERIWVRNGYLTAGNATNPYPYPLEIILIGGKSSSDLVIDSFINSGNKILAVTGKLDLYGLIPSKTSTRLSNIISKGDTSIDLIEAVDWNIGWEILIGPTEKSSNEYEKKVISDIINGGKTLVLAEPIEFFHYGSNNFAYISDEGSHLDMRAVVGVLSRNIRIKGDKQENLGCNILVYQYTDEYSGRIRRGNINFEGVEISFCGQSDTERAALDIKYIKKGSISSVRGSTIHDGFGWGLNVFSSNSLIFEQNIISNCQKYLAKFSFSNNFSFSRNLLIGARNRNLSSALNLYDMVAGFSMESAISGNSNFVVHHNIIQGSQGNGFVVPGFKCDDNLNTFVFNSANSIEHAGVILLGNNSYCLELRNLTIFTSKYAVLSNFEAQGIVLKSMIFAENIFGPFIMYSNEGMDNRIIYKDVVFIAIARDNCPECYAENTSCSNSKAIILPIVTISGNGKSLPLYKSPFGLVTLDSDAAFDQQLFIENVRFINYKMNYTDGDNKNFFSCHSNVIFKMRDSAPDASASVQIANTKLVNSETASFFSLTSPSSSLTGCGNHMCTGENNWLFTDMDGLFLGSKSQIIPLNSGIYDARCNQNLKWNGQICSGYNFGILQFENNGADQRTRPIAPVSLSSLHMRNKLNQWKEWQWEGQTPRNRRLSRFHGLVELNVSVTAGFEVTVPESMKFRLESKDVNDFVLLNIVYERPNVIEVWNAVSSKFITPFRANQTNLLDEKANCGANIYDSNLNKISFILTGGKNCILTIRTVDSVKITMRMETTLDDFYKNNGEATFFDKMSTFLGIDFSRIRIANIRSGSVIIDFHIVENRTFEKGTSSSESILKNPNDTLKVDQLHFDTKNREFNHIMDQLANVTSDENNTLGLPWQVLDMKTEPVINNPNNLTVNNNNQTTNESSSIDWGAVNSTNNETIVASVRDNDNGDGKLTLEFIIALSVIIPSLLIILIIGCCCINIRGGSSLFKIIVQKIFGKQEELSSRAIRYSGDFRNVKINQILPQKDFDLEENATDEKSSPIMNSPEHTQKTPFAFKKNEEME